MATTEQEIFGRLAESLKTAAEDCAVLAWHPRRGWVYDRFRKGLGVAEGCCRQVYYWRNYDARWLMLAMLFERIHRRAGDWLRNSPTKNARNAVHPKFGELAGRLQKIHYDAERIKTAATGNPGPIMPTELPGPHRDTRPVQVVLPGERLSGGGVIVPDGAVIGGPA